MIYLTVYNKDETFKKDATFKIQKGLINKNAYSFESLNYPGFFIRHKQSLLMISNENSELFKNDATFKLLK